MIFNFYYAWYKLWMEAIFELKSVKNCRNIDVKRIDDHEKRMIKYGI